MLSERSDGSRPTTIKSATCALQGCAIVDERALPVSTVRALIERGRHDPSAGGGRVGKLAHAQLDATTLGLVAAEGEL